jgi:hypothetical protein
VEDWALEDGVDFFAKFFRIFLVPCDGDGGVGAYEFGNDVGVCGNDDMN